MLRLPHTPGALLADPDGALLGATDEARSWLGVAGQNAVDLVRDLCAAGLAPGVSAHVLLRLDGRPALSAHGSIADGRVAVVVQRATPATLLPAVEEEYALTPREREVLRLLLAGRTDRKIAAELVVAPDTAREHSGRVLRKLGVRRRAALPALLFPHVLGDLG